MKLLGKIIYGVIAGLTGLVFLASVWMLGARVIGGQDLPSLFGYTPISVLSGSMETAFCAGDLVIIHRQDAYQQGDIVTYADANGVLVTHRIVDEMDGSFVTKGDANNVEDQTPVQLSQIKGRVVLNLPKMGHVVLFIRSPGGMLLALSLGMVILFLPDWLTRRRGRRKENAK